MALDASAAATAPRDRLLVALVRQLGLTLHQAVALDAADVRRTRTDAELTVTDKTGSRRSLPLPPEVLLLLTETLGDRETGPLLMASQRGPIRLDVARRILIRAAGARTMRECVEGQPVRLPAL